MPSNPPVTDTNVFDLALEIFAEEGFEGMSVRQLCRRLGVSHNLVHERYGSKDELWRLAIDHGFASLALALAQAATDASEDPLDRLRAILVRYVEVTATRPEIIRIINYEAMHPGPRLDYLFDTYLRPAHFIADAALQLLERQGRAHRIPAATLHFMIGHGAGGLASLPDLAARFGPDDPDPVTQARDAVDLVLRGILRSPGEAPLDDTRRPRTERR